MVFTVKVAVVYYSRTGNTERVVEILKSKLIGFSIHVDVYRVTPVAEYTRPLHFNIRLIRDILTGRSIDVRFEPGEPELTDYDVIIVASPVWYNTLAPSVQEFLKKYTSAKPLVVISSSGLNVDYSTRMCEVARELSGVKPALCVNIPVKVLRDSAGLDSVVESVAREVVKLLRFEKKQRS